MAQGQELFEREDELERLDDAVLATVAGSGRLVVVEGPAGIGKTALLGEMCRRARRRGMTVLSAQGATLERDFGFGVVRQLLEARVHAAAPDERRRVLARAARLAAPVVAPDEADPATPAHPDAIVHGLYWLTANLAEAAPVLLAVDDTHWADGPSLAFLSYLARRLEGLPVLVVATVRTGDARTDESVVAELVAGDGVQTIRPRALSVRGVAALVGKRLPGDIDPSFAAACHAATGGVPFLVRELVAALHADRVEPNAPAAARVGEIAPTTVAHATALGHASRRRR